MSSWQRQTTTETARRNTSLWWDQLSTEEVSLVRPALTGVVNADVAIVGAGYTGLWTAYWTLKNSPTTKVVIIEREVAGFGASGRNGGWCSSYFPASMDKIARESGRNAAIAMQRTMDDIITEIGQVIEAEKIDCDWKHGGILSAVLSDVQLERATAEMQWWDSWGFGADHTLLDLADARSRINVAGMRTVTYTPHCARIQPAKLARGLARVVESMGATIFEHTAAVDINPGVVTCESGEVRASKIIRATEAYTSQFKRSHRDVVPVYSLMLATEPLSEEVWAQIGLKNGETFADHRHLIIYGQRTADNRIAFGGRGAPYHYGSSIKPQHDRNAKTHAEIREVLVELFPILSDVKITHTWGGPLGVPRDWYATVGLDPTTGLGWGGGYVGDGVGSSALAGHTLADLITGVDSARTTLPWVNRRSQRWEFEPFRWLGTNIGLKVMTAADTEERITRHPSIAARLFGRLLGQ